MTDGLRQTPHNAPANTRGLVVIAASAGGITAIGDVLAGLPGDFPLPIAVVQHRSAITPGFLPEVFQRRTTLKVLDARQAESPMPGFVYLAPADRHLTIEGPLLIPTEGPKVLNLRPAADVLFESAAEVYGTRLIAVILSGEGSDGSNGCKAVKQNRGTVIAQEPEDAEHSGMPSSAVQTGTADFVLPLREIAQKLIALACNGRPERV